MATLEYEIVSQHTDLKKIGASLRNSSPEEVLAYAIDRFPAPTLTMATAFGAEGCVIISMLASLPHGKDVRIFNLDTGYQFAETLELRDRILDRYGINVELVRAAESVIEMETRFGGPIYSSNPDECCRIRKIEPLKKALSGHDAWITAIRRDQTRDRSSAEMVEWDHKFNLVKINPLAYWTQEDVWAYISINEVPYNPLHDAGYPSIGCKPCTRAVLHGEGERGGRWSSLPKLECGLHSRSA
jgi:phosphoadenosine phosphosulfate reductase